MAGGLSFGIALTVIVAAITYTLGAYVNPAMALGRADANKVVW